MDSVDSNEIHPLKEEESPQKTKSQDSCEIEFMEHNSQWSNIPLGKDVSEQEKRELQTVLLKHVRCFSNQLGHPELFTTPNRNRRSSTNFVTPKTSYAIRT